MNKYLEQGDHRSFLSEPDGIGSLTQDGLQEAMICACDAGFIELVGPIAQLLRDVNFRFGQAVWTPLHLAVEMGHVPVVEALLQHQADPNAGDRSGAGPLHLAVDMEADTAHQSGMKPSPEISSLLVKSGADVERPDDTGATPRSIAEDYEYTEFLEMIGKP